MAARTGSRDVCMVERGRRPRRGRVTFLAIIAARDMSRVFAGCRDPVMTGGAGANDLRVIDGHDRGPADGAVTVLAGVRCLHVIGGLAGRVNAIRLGYGEYRTKYDRLKNILKYIDTRKRFPRIDTIDISNPDRVVLRPVMLLSSATSEKEVNRAGT